MEIPIGKMADFQRDRSVIGKHIRNVFKESELCKNNKVLPSNMGLLFASDEFKSNTIKGFVFMSENQGPYLFHCTEAKDRGGYFTSLIEALMGAYQ